MGWSFGWDTKQELTEYVTAAQRWTTEDGRSVYRETIKKTMRGNCLWTVQRTQVMAQPPQELIVLYLFEYDRRSRQWGYTDMSEDCGLYYWTCPLKWFDTIPAGTDTARKWRSACRAYQARMRRA